jgi:hypothetical protein
MGADQMMQLLAAFALGAVLAGSGVGWWLSRQIQNAGTRLARSEHAREQSGQQLTQARRQIETLQMELGEVDRARRQQAVARVRAQHHTGPGELDGRQVVATPREDTDKPADGFADTMLLMPDRS